VGIHIEIETGILGRKKRNVAFGVDEIKNEKEKRSGNESERSCCNEKENGLERGSEKPCCKGKGIGLGTGVGNVNVIE
jgi:hypothetical protein